MSVLRKALSGARAYAPAAASLRSRGKRFVIVCPGRCGSELLVDLLQSQPGMVCDGEILRHKVRFPKLFMEARAQRAVHAGADFYGCKVLVSQLDSIQRLGDPAAFLARLDAHGWALLGLTRRNVLRQSLSWLWAMQRDDYHQRRGNDSPSSGPETLTVAPDQLIAMMGLSEQASRFVDEVTAAARRWLKLTYEDDLEQPDRHQATVDAVMGWLGACSAPASTDLVPTGAGRLAERISNFDDVTAAVRRTRFAPLLEGEN